MRKIGIVTSGGDAPGINAAIRAIVRIAYLQNLSVIGFERGWEGLITNTFRQLTPRSVGGIIHLGGTILRTSRCLQFTTKEGLLKAAGNLALNNVDGLIVIGGNGSFDGSLELSKATDTVIVGLPATIDNDVFGTDETIGFDTAVNTAVHEIDKIRDTAISHERLFIVEVMGRTRGFLALTVGVTVGAEIILLPEEKLDYHQVIQQIKDNSVKGKKSGIIVAAEGVGDTRLIARNIEKDTKAEVRLSILGYAQRGGNPTARSRLLACLFARKAINLLLAQQGSRIVGVHQGNITSIDLTESCQRSKPIDQTLLTLARNLAI